MAVLASRLDTRSEAFAANRDAMESHVAGLESILAEARAGGGDKYVERHRAREKLLPRERIE
ncbi:MAG: acyl-CoA carboxylase subunit beta, partial [Acidimicrobiia bacterium]|nr:acyl-CoA carboxylase subunit beta [Acidimicrobiia bacterium]